MESKRYATRHAIRYPKSNAPLILWEVRRYATRHATRHILTKSNHFLAIILSVIQINKGV